MKHLLPALLLLTSFIFAQSSSEHFNFQGFHMIGGKPANGNFRVTFKMFDQINDGNELWTSGPIDDLPLVNGVYQRALGQNNVDAWGAIDWSVGNKFIEVTIGDVAKERTQLMAVPIAIGAHRAAEAENAEKLDGRTIAELKREVKDEIGAIRVYTGVLRNGDGETICGLDNDLGKHKIIQVWVNQGGVDWITPIFFQGNRWFKTEYYERENRLILWNNFSSFYGRPFKVLIYHVKEF